MTELKMDGDEGSVCDAEVSSVVLQVVGCGIPPHRTSAP